jgi:hypothetical protein
MNALNKNSVGANEITAIPDNANKPFWRAAERNVEHG